jgi:hypothetical protein
MPIRTLDDEAIEESTFILMCDFTDEAGDAVTPKTIAWTLSDPAGEMIAEGSVSIPAASVDIVLKGVHLAIQEGETDNVVYRIFTIEAVYDSDAGTDLPLKDSYKFPLRNRAAVS